MMFSPLHVRIVSGYINCGWSFIHIIYDRNLDVAVSIIFVVASDVSITPAPGGRGHGAVSARVVAGKHLVT